MSSHLSETLDNSNDRIQYDANAKNILSNKDIIAKILEYVIPDFKGMPLHEIKKYRVSAISG